MLSIQRQIKGRGKSTVRGWLGKHKGVVGRSRGPTECRTIEMNRHQTGQVAGIGFNQARICSRGLIQGEDHGRIHRGYEVRINERS